MDTKTLGKIVAFLCSVPPDSYLRLMLQLALAAEIPEDKQDSLVLPLTGAKKLIDLLKNEKLLERLIAADGELGDAEKNMLSEAMDKVGLVVPMKMETTDLLLEELSENLVEEIEELENSGSVSGNPTIW